MTLRDFHEIFEVGIYIQKKWHFALRDVFIYKKLDSSQKAGQFAIRLYIQKSGTFTLRDFPLNFWNLRRGEGNLFIKKTMYFAWHFYIEKQCTLRFVAIYKESDTMRYILICKKQNTFLYVHIYILWWSDQKINSSSLLRIGPIPTINKDFSLHTREWERTAPLGMEHVRYRVW